MSDILFLDAQTFDEEFRLTSFADDIILLAQDYQSWAEEKGYKQEHMWYSDVFRYNEKKPKKPDHVASFVIEEDGSVSAMPPQKEVRNPYKRKKTMGELIKHI